MPQMAMMREIRVADRRERRREGAGEDEEGKDEREVKDGFSVHCTGERDGISFRGGGGNK